jgi:hypothetical protein
VLGVGRDDLVGGRVADLVLDEERGHRLERAVVPCRGRAAVAAVQVDLFDLRQVRVDLFRLHVGRGVFLLLAVLAVRSLAVRLLAVAVIVAGQQRA